MNKGDSLISAVRRYVVSIITGQRLAGAAGSTEPTSNSHARLRLFDLPNKLFIALIGIFYLIIFAEKPTAILFDGIADETLYIGTALHIVEGQWLGPYNVDTLMRPPAFPLFLALNYMTGIPINVALGILYFVSALYISYVAGRAACRKSVFYITFLALCVSPLFFDVSMQRLLRDPFYCCLTLLFFAGLLDFILSPEVRSRWLKAIFAGAIGGVMWLTREEGFWIVPATIAAIFLGVLRIHEIGRPGFRRMIAQLFGGLLASVVVVMIPGFINLHYYGRFVLSETQESGFQAALTALRRASYYYQTPYAQVPKTARLLIYKHSPSFARLKFFFDPDDGKPIWRYPCAEQFSSIRSIKVDCTDPTAWFVWGFRDASSQIGVYSDPNTAAQFYRSIANEVKSACAQGSLKCGPWLPPLVPYMNAAQRSLLLHFIWDSFKLFALIPPMSFKVLPSAILDRKAEVLALLNDPPHDEGESRRLFKLVGWYHGHGDEWVSITGKVLEGSLKVQQVDSPDLVTHFGDALLSKNRFIISGACIRDKPCTVDFTDKRGAPMSFDIANTKVPANFSLGEGTIYVDATRWRNEVPWMMRAGLYNFWVVIIGTVKPICPIVIFAGYVGAAVVFIRAVYMRQITAISIIVATLGVAVFTRAALLSLVSATSFPAIHYPYGAPGVTLSIALAVSAIVEILRRPRFQPSIMNIHPTGSAADMNVP